MPGTPSACYGLQFPNSSPCCNRAAGEYAIHHTICAIFLLSQATEFIVLGHTIEKNDRELAVALHTYHFELYHAVLNPSPELGVVSLNVSERSFDFSPQNLPYAAWSPKSRLPAVKECVASRIKVAETIRLVKVTKYQHAGVQTTPIVAGNTYIFHNL